MSWELGVGSWGVGELARNSQLFNSLTLQLSNSPTPNSQLLESRPHPQGHGPTRHDRDRVRLAALVVQEIVADGRQGEAAWKVHDDRGPQARGPLVARPPATQPFARQLLRARTLEQHAMRDAQSIVVDP